MSIERWDQIKEIFQSALDHEPAVRRAFLAEACGDDEELRDEIVSLLDAYEQGTGFSMDEPLVVPSDVGQDEGSGARAMDKGVHVKICRKCWDRFAPEQAVCPADGEVLVYEDEAFVGRTLDGTYEIELFLGKGAMGMVYRARHLLLLDKVAIKIMAPKFATDPEWVRRFLREGQAARAIRHPNAVSVLDLRTTADGIAYMVQEYVEGRTLRDLLKQGAMSIQDAVELLAPIAAALDAAHAAGVVHRDLKPDNIMVGEEPGRATVKLLDLGIAKIMSDPDMNDQPTTLTIPGQTLGTPRYMSPEQWGVTPTDGGHQIDGRTDVYSLGLILYEAVAGSPPFPGRTSFELRQQHLVRIPTSLDTVAEGVGAEAAAAVNAALAKDRSERPSTPGEFIANVRAALRSGESPAVPDRRSGENPAVPDHRRPNRIAPIAAVGALTIAAVAALIPNWNERVNNGAPQPPPPHAAPQPRSEVWYSLTVQKYRDGKPAGAQFASDGRHIFEKDYRVRVNITSPRAGYLYILNESPAPDPKTGLPYYSVLFPEPKTNGGSPQVAGETAVMVPAQQWIAFDDEKGTERLWLVWSPESVGPLDGIDRYVNEKQKGVIDDGERIAAIRDLLSQSSRRPPEAQADAETKRTTVRSQSPTLVHLLRLEHE